MDKAIRPDDQDPAYHEAHRDDPDEWEETGVTVDPQPTSMTVFSLRLPAAELAALKAEADARGTTVSDLVRSAVRTVLAQRASGALSYGTVWGTRIHSSVVDWHGGTSAPGQIQGAPELPVVIPAKR
jgi:hypothetical protein